MRALVWFRLGPVWGQFGGESHMRALVWSCGCVCGSAFCQDVSHEMGRANFSGTQSCQNAGFEGPRFSLDWYLHHFCQDSSGSAGVS